MVENSGPHLSGQSLMDIAVQEYGAVSQVFELVRANGLRGITDNVWAGDELVIPGSGPNRQRAAFMQAHQPIATIQDTDRAAGIGFWRIHFELKVS